MLALNDADNPFRSVCLASAIHPLLHRVGGSDIVFLVRVVGSQKQCPELACSHGWINALCSGVLSRGAVFRCFFECDIFAVPSIWVVHMAQIICWRRPSIHIAKGCHVQRIVARFFGGGDGVFSLDQLCKKRKYSNMDFIGVVSTTAVFIPRRPTVYFEYLCVVYARKALDTTLVFVDFCGCCVHTHVCDQPKLHHSHIVFGVHPLGGERVSAMAN